MTARESLMAERRRLLVDALTVDHGCVRAAARRLGVSERTAWSWCASLSVLPAEYRDRGVSK